MLHEEIKTRNQERLVILQLADDIKEELSIYGGYRVNVKQDSRINIISEADFFTDVCILEVQSVLKAYQVKYKGINYAFFIEMSRPVIEIWTNMSFL